MSIFFDKVKGVKTLVSTKAISLDRTKKEVNIKNLKNGDKAVLPYDTLMIATGSQPVVLPIPGNDADGVFTISDLHKAIAIKDRIAKGKVGKAVVIGGGAIGIEMAESLSDLWGIETTLLEFADQLLPRIIDWPLATILEKHLRDNNIDVFLGEGAEEIVTKDGCVVAVRTGKRTIEADLVIMAVGIRPRSEIALEAGLLVSQSGAIVVNERMQTSDPDIYAAGDCVEITHLVSGKKFIAPFGSMANKEGRVVADNMAGIPTVFKGGVGSFILKAFELSIGSVGLSLEAAKAEGFDAVFSLSSPSDRAHFFPGQEIFCLELIFDRRTRRILGFQGTGPLNDALSTRIDSAAVALCAGATIDDFSNVEMAYSPPFSSAIDPLNAAGYIADNLCADRMRQISMKEFYRWMEEPSLHPEWLVLDVRHEQQAQPLVEQFGKDLWLSLPQDQVHDRYLELPTDKMLVLFCNAGSRSFEIQVFLDHVGLHNTTVLPGGFNTIKRMGASWLSAT